MASFGMVPTVMTPMTKFTRVWSMTVMALIAGILALFGPSLGLELETGQIIVFVLIALVFGGLGVAMVSADVVRRVSGR